MKSVQLNTRQRINLAILLGVQRGTVKDIMLLMSIIKKVDLTDAQRADIGFVAEPNGLVRWDNKSAEALGIVIVQLEDAEATKVKGVIEEWPQFQPVDAEWVSPVLSALQ